MAYENKINTSIHGRRLGLQRLTTPETGGSRGNFDVLVGAEAVRSHVTTNPTTSTNLKPFGHTLLTASSAGSSQVYTLDPPVPGMRKVITNSTDATAFIKTANTETIKSTVGATQHVIAMPAAGAMIELIGETTARWRTAVSTASGINLTNST